MQLQDQMRKPLARRLLAQAHQLVEQQQGVQVRRETDSAGEAVSAVLLADKRQQRRTNSSNFFTFVAFADDTS